MRGTVPRPSSEAASSPTANRTVADGPASGPSAWAASAASLITTPWVHSVAAQATTMKPATRFVSSAPTVTSIREPRRSLAVRPLSTTYDWMNDWPQGVIVVPTTPTTVRMYAALVTGHGG